MQTEEEDLYTWLFFASAVELLKKNQTILMGLRANIVVPEEQDAYMFS